MPWYSATTYFYVIDRAEIIEFGYRYSLFRCFFFSSSARSTAAEPFVNEIERGRME